MQLQIKAQDAGVQRDTLDATKKKRHKMQA